MIVGPYVGTGLGGVVGVSLGAAVGGYDGRPVGLVVGETLGAQVSGVGNGVGMIVGERIRNSTTSTLMKRCRRCSLNSRREVKPWPTPAAWTYRAASSVRYRPHDLRGVHLVDHNDGAIVMYVSATGTSCRPHGPHPSPLLHLRAYTVVNKMRSELSVSTL